jgi:hypothetical protein
MNDDHKLRSIFNGSPLTRSAQPKPHGASRPQNMLRCGTFLDAEFPKE